LFLQYHCIYLPYFFKQEIQINRTIILKEKIEIIFENLPISPHSLYIEEIIEKK